jgi:hypothetical protein
MAAEDIKLDPRDVTQKANDVARAITQAATPGPVPAPGAGSPIDTALAGMAGKIAQNIAASSAKLAAQGAEGLVKSTTAVEQMTTTEHQNTRQLSQVAERLPEQQGTIAT